MPDSRDRVSAETGDTRPWLGLRPGHVFRLLVERHGAKIVVRVKLGSMKDAIADVLPLNNSLVDL
jgi:hypothetical protein